MARPCGSTGEAASIAHALRRAGLYDALATWAKRYGTTPEELAGSASPFKGFELIACDLAASEYADCTPNADRAYAEGCRALGLNPRTMQKRKRRLLREIEGARST